MDIKGQVFDMKILQGWALANLVIIFHSFLHAMNSYCMSGIIYCNSTYTKYGAKTMSYILNYKYCTRFWVKKNHV